MPRRLRFAVRNVPTRTHSETRSRQPPVPLLRRSASTGNIAQGEDVHPLPSPIFHPAVMHIEGYFGMDPTDYDDDQDEGADMLYEGEEDTRTPEEKALDQYYRDLAGYAPGGEDWDAEEALNNENASNDTEEGVEELRAYSDEEDFQTLEASPPSMLSKEEDESMQFVRQRLFSDAVEGMLELSHLQGTGSEIEFDDESVNLRERYKSHASSISDASDNINPDFAIEVSNCSSASGPSRANSASDTVNTSSEYESSTDSEEFSDDTSVSCHNVILRNTRINPSIALGPILGSSGRKCKVKDAQVGLTLRHRIFRQKKSKFIPQIYTPTSEISEEYRTEEPIVPPYLGTLGWAIPEWEKAYLDRLSIMNNSPAPSWITEEMWSDDPSDGDYDDNDYDDHLMGP